MFNLIKKVVYKGRYYSWRLELILFLQHILVRCIDEKSLLIQYLYKKRDFLIENYLIKKDYFKADIKDVSSIVPKKKISSSIIWIYWAQGWEKAPQHVKLCLNSVVKNSNRRKVICISDDNYREFVNIPKYIEEKRTKGIITTTHFSDILRYTLLAEYGGLWLDASIFLMKSLDEKILEKNLFTISLKNDFSNNRIISHARWVGSCIGSCKSHYKLFEIGRNFFFEYWKEEKMLINYFLIDYFMDIILKKDKEIKNDLLENGFTNQGIYKLSEVINSTNLSILSKPIYQETSIYYLSWKKDYKETINGKKTIYGYLIEKYLR